jgi:hypothetical protein
MRAAILASLTLFLFSSPALAQGSSQSPFQRLYADYLDSCMKDWDTETHMTRDQWRRTCQRVASERARFRAEQDEINAAAQRPSRRDTRPQ